MRVRLFLSIAILGVASARDASAHHPSKHRLGTMTATVAAPERDLAVDVATIVKAEVAPASPAGPGDEAPLSPCSLKAPGRVAELFCSCMPGESHRDGQPVPSPDRALERASGMDSGRVPSTSWIREPDPRAGPRSDGPPPTPPPEL